jgi:hypothetical protein
MILKFLIKPLQNSCPAVGFIDFVKLPDRKLLHSNRNALMLRDYVLYKMLWICMAL